MPAAPGILAGGLAAHGAAVTDAGPPAPPAPALVDTVQAGPRVIRGGALRVVGHVFGLLLALGSSAMLNRHLGVVDAGRYITVLSLAVLAAGVSDAGLATIGLREYVVRDGPEREQFLRNLITIRLVLTLFGMVAACSYAVLAGFDSTLILGTAIAGLGVLLTTLQMGLATVLVTDLRLGWVTLAEAMRQLTGALTVVALVLLGASLLPFFVATVVGGLTTLLLTVVVVRRLSLLRPAFDRQVLRSLAREALPFAAATAAAALYLRVGVLVVALVSAGDQTGYYSVSFRVVEAIIAIPALAVGTAFPVFARAARDDRLRLRYAVQRTLEVGLLAGTGAAVVLVSGAPLAIEAVGGGAFAPAVPVLRLHALAICLSFASPVLGYALLSLRAHRAILVTSLVGLGVVLVGSVLGAELAGARGAAAAGAAGELALVVTAWLALRRHGLALEVGVVGRLPLPAAVALLPALALPALPAAVLAGAIFTVTAFLVGAVPDEVRQELRWRRPASRGED